MTLKETVLAQIPPEKYYQSRFPQWNVSYKLNVLCPWHELKSNGHKPSLAICLQNGGARCHGCGKSLGNVVHFESSLREITEGKAAYNLYEEFIRPFFPSDRIKKFKTNLQFAPQQLQRINNDLGLSIKTIEEFKLGWDYESHRLIIPVSTSFGGWSNIRLYKLPSDRSSTDKSPKIYNAKGYGSCELYPWNAIRDYDPDIPLVWMKSERCTLLGIQMGFQCFCITGSGESASIGPWLNELKEFSIYICGDNDVQGIKHAQKRFDEIQPVCKFAKIIQLPTKSVKDFSDWVLKEEGDSDKFEELLDDVETAPTRTQFENTGKLIPLSELKSILNEKVKTKAIVIGRMDRSYSIPFRFKIAYSGGVTKNIEIPLSRELLWLINSNDDDIASFVVQKILKEKKARATPIAHITATEVELAPIVDLTSQGTHCTYNAIFIGDDLQTNVPYELDVIPTSSIKTQEQVGIVTAARPISSVLDSKVFQLNNLKKLDVFRIDSDPWESLCNFANEISLQFTRIYNRTDWHIVALLTYLSPLYFDYPNEGCQRGWINSLVVGDTKTGKSQVAHSLQKTFQCGTIVNSENCTFVGLVGGTVKNSGGQFMLRWGRLPVNDRQLVIMEELSGLSTEAISRMSDVRSSGIARIDKGGITAETTARTRLIALSNVRGQGKALESYTSGIRALFELIGQAEDISRFDLICTLTDGEVPSGIINRKTVDFNEIGTYSATDLQALVRFIWSLKPEQINFTQSAYLASLQTAQEMAKIYHPSVPLFKAAAGRLSLARIACAIACAQFNWIKDQIHVTSEHIACARQVLELTYNKPSLGYKSYSKKMFASDTIKNEGILDKKFMEVFSTEERRNRVWRFLETNGHFSEKEMESLTGCPQFKISAFIGSAVDSNIIERNSRDWSVTVVGKKWIDKNLNL